MGCGRAQRVVEKPLPVTEGRLSSLAFSPDSKTLATSYTRLRGTPGGGVVLWDVAGCKRLIQAALPETRGQVASVAFAPDGKTLAAACGLESNSVVFWDSVMLWDVAGHKRVMQLLLPARASAGRRGRAWPLPLTAKPWPPHTSAPPLCCITRPARP